MRSLHQVSSGGVVFKSSRSGASVCLVARPRDGCLVWCLPKGHVEARESLREAALREVREETGLSGVIVSPLGSIRYSFFDRESENHILKQVHFFLIRSLGGKLNDHDDEVEEARWFPSSQVLARAEYPSEREVLRKALLKIKLIR